MEAKEAKNIVLRVLPATYRNLLLDEFAGAYPVHVMNTIAILCVRVTYDHYRSTT